MNQKKRFKTDFKPEFLHEVPITRGSKTYLLRKGMHVGVNRRPGLIAGDYEFLYAYPDNAGMLLVVEGPVSRGRRHKYIREADIKAVRIKTEGRE